MQWHTEAGKITNNLRVEVEFTLHALSLTNSVIQKCNENCSTNGRYDMILGRDIFTSLWLNLKFYDPEIEADYGTLKGSTEPVVDLGTYEFKDLNAGKITPAELFTNTYTEELYES